MLGSGRNRSLTNFDTKDCFGLSTKPKVSVIVPTKNEERNIGRCLKSIKNQELKDVEIIVVDNNSSDKTCQVARKFGAKVFEAGPERDAQRNFGAKKSTANILLFVDADMELGKEVASQAVEALKNDRRLVALIVPEDTAGQNFWARVIALERRCYLGEPLIEAPRIFTKEAFLKVAGFDEKLVAGEDWDLKNRISKLGKIGRIKAKIIHHEDFLSLTSHLKKKYYYAKNIHLYWQKHPEKFRAQSGLTRFLILARNWRKLASDPIHGTGVIILKLLEYLVFVLSKI